MKAAEGRKAHCWTGKETATVVDVIVAGLDSVSVLENWRGPFWKHNKKSILCNSFFTLFRSGLYWFCMLNRGDFPLLFSAKCFRSLLFTALVFNILFMWIQFGIQEDFKFNWNSSIWAQTHTCVQGWAVVCSRCEQYGGEWICTCLCFTLLVDWNININ